MVIIAIVLGTVLVAQIALNVLITRRVLASDYYEPFQKGAQIAIMWLLPVVGLILVWSLFHHDGPRNVEESEDEDDDDVEESIFGDHDSVVLPSADASVPDASIRD